MLLERQYLMLLLMEAREDGIIKRFVPEIVKKSDGLLNMSNHVINLVKPYLPAQMVEPDPSNPQPLNSEARWAEAIIRFIIENDPDPKKTYATWMTLMFVRGLFNLEDMPRMIGAITLYAQAKQAGHISRSHDLMTIKTMDAFYDLVAPFRQSSKGEVVDQTVEMAMRKKSKVLLDTPEYFVVCPLTKEAAQWYGRDTDWCTAYGGKYSVNHKSQTSLYDSYKDAPLYVIEVKATDEIFQFSFEHGQFMDREDRQIVLRDFLTTHMPVCRAIGMKHFAHLIGRKGVTLEFFAPEDLVQMDGQYLGKGVNSMEDLKRVPESKFSDAGLLETIVRRFSQRIGILQNLPGGTVNDHQKFSTPEAKNAIKPILNVLMGHLSKEAFVEGLAKGGGQPLFSGLPKEYLTDDLKGIMAQHTEYDEIETYIPKPWPKAVEQGYYESAAKAGGMRAEDIPVEYRSAEVLTNAFLHFPYSMQNKEVANRVHWVPIVRRLTALVTGPNWDRIDDVCRYIPKDHLTQPLAVELYRQARQEPRRTDAMLLALTRFDFSLWPWKNGKMINQMVIEWDGKFDDLPPRLQNMDTARLVVDKNWSWLGRMSKKWLTPEVVEIALIQTIKQRGQQDKTQLRPGASSVLNASDPSVLDPALVASVMMAKIDRSLFPQVWDTTPEKFRTKEFAAVLAEHGALPFNSKWFPEDKFTPEFVNARMKTLLPTIRNNFSIIYQRNYTEVHKRDATEGFISDIQGLWQTIPQPKRTSSLLAGVVQEYPDMILGVDKSLLTAEVMDAWIQAPNQYKRTPNGGRGSAHAVSDAMLFTKFPRSAYTPFNMALAVKRALIKKVPDDLVDDSVLVSMLNRGTTESDKIDWKRITPEIFAKAATVGNAGVAYLKAPLNLVQSPLVARAILDQVDKPHFYAGSAVSSMFKKPETRVNWDQSLYDDAARLGILPIEAIPEQFRHDGLDMASIKKTPENILQVKDPVAWLNKHDPQGTFGNTFLKYGIVCKPDKTWVKPAPDKKCEDGSAYTIVPISGGSIGLMFGKDGQFVDGVFIGGSAPKQSYSYGGERIRLISKFSSNYGGNINYRPIRHAFCAVLNIANNKESLGHTMDYVSKSAHIYRADNEFHLVENMPRKKFGSLQIVKPGNLSKWDGEPIFLFDGNAPSYFGMVKIEGTTFAADGIIGDVGKYLHLSDDLADFMMWANVASGSGPKFKESNLFKLGVRGPGKSEWYSLIGEEVMSVGSLKVWKGSGRVSVSHEKYGVIVVGKKTKDGSFVSTETLKLPDELNKSYLTVLDPLFAAMKGKI